MMPDSKQLRIDENTRFNTLLQQYRIELRRFLRRRLRSSHDMEDISQEVFARFLRVDPKQVHKPRSYLFGIAAHVLREFRMRLQHEQEWITVDSEAMNSAAEQPARSRHDDLAEQLSMQRELLAALAQLPPMQRTVLLMVKHDGLSYEEAAQATQLSINTIERYVVEARAKLKASLWDRPGKERP